MKASTWHRWCNSLFGPEPTRPVSRASRRRQPLCLRTLEDRAVPSGTPTMVADLNPGLASSYPSDIVVVGSMAYFLTNDGDYQYSLWKTDGTTGGTVLVKELADTTWETVPRDLTDVNGTLYFTAYDPVHGVELWKSDGTTAGTVMVKDINPGIGVLSQNSGPGGLTNVNGTLFFVATDGVHGYELWKSDGTVAGTVLVKDIRTQSAYIPPYNLTNVNGTLFFVANDGVHGYEVWKSDGTTAGTVMVKDIQPNLELYGGQLMAPRNLTDVNGTLFFTAFDDNTGFKLWKSDGTAAGTVALKLISDYAYDFTIAGGTLYFRVVGAELWKSDGTAAGTVRVVSINPGGATLDNLTDVDGTLFFVCDDGAHDNELWTSDGTVAGTTLVKDIYPGGSMRYHPGYYSYPTGYIPPWSEYALNSSYPSNLTNVNGTLYFTAEDGVHGRELWESDGTAAGTVLVADINPGSSSYGPGSLTNVNGTLLFAADDGTHGRELWKLDPGGPPAIVITDVSQVEGNAGTAGAEFIVQLSAPSSEPVSVRYSTADGTATVGSDYVATAGTLTFEPGQTSLTISVPVLGDRLGEPDETFVVNLDSPINGTILDGHAVGTILDDEPRISINDKTVTEGNTGSTSALFTVTLSAAYDVNVTVAYATANGSATAGSDYQAVSATLTFVPGETSKTVPVPVIGDRLPEANETYFVNLSNPTNALIVDGQGVGTIRDDEPRISINDVTKKEGRRGHTTLFTFTVTLSVPYDEPVTVSFQTTDRTATTVDNDYVAQTGTLTFAPGETTKTITIVVNGDNKREADETFYLNLFGNSSNSLFTKSHGTGTILNDD